MATLPDQNQNETLDPPNSPQSDDNNNDQQQQQAIKTEQAPILLAETQSPPPPPMTSSSRNTTTTSNKRRKTYKRKKPTKKIIHLTNTLNPIPFIPPKTLDLIKHQDVLKKVELYEFSKIDFDRVRVMLKTDLIVQLIGNYDPKKRCSYVNDSRVAVNRADLARALKLPPARQDRDRFAVEEVDLDSEVFSDESIEFLEEFVQKWIVVRDEPRVVSGEIASWARCIRDGHPEKMDVASLIWGRVEKELSLGDKLVDCYYASHLLCLIRSQKPDFFLVDDEEKEKEEEEECMVNLETEVEEPAVEEVTITDQHTKDDETMADADLDEQVDFTDVSGDHFLQPCRNSSLVNVEQVEDEHAEEVKVKVEQVEDEHHEEVKVKEVEDEHVEEVKVEEVEHEHIEEVKVEEVEDEHVEQVEDERIVDTVNIADDVDVPDEDDEVEELPRPRGRSRKNKGEGSSSTRFNKESVQINELVGRLETNVTVIGASNKQQEKLNQIFELQQMLADYESLKADGFHEEARLLNERRREKMREYYGY